MQFSLHSRYYYQEILYVYIWLVVLSLMVLHQMFQVRRKDFWLLSTVGKLLKEFIPHLSHDADGLVFQVLRCQLRF